MHLYQLFAQQKKFAISMSGCNYLHLMIRNYYLHYDEISPLLFKSFYKSITYMVEFRAIVHICEAILGLQSYNALLDDLSVVI